MSFVEADATFHSIATEAELRRKTAALLGRWSAALRQGKLRCHLPRRAGLMRFVPGMTFHMRPELFLQVSGSTTFSFPEQTIRVGPGELCLVPAGLPHGEKAAAGRGARGAGEPFCNLVFMYHEGVPSFHLARAKKGGPYVALASRLAMAREEDVARLAALLGPLPDWGEERGAAWEETVQGALLCHLGLLRAALEQVETPPIPTEPLKVTQARRVVMQNLSRPDLSASWIARSLQSSPDYLSRLFRAATGTSLTAYLDVQRLAQARSLLKTSSLNIAQIGRACGYDDPGYFARRFRKGEGLTPRAYRALALRPL